MWIFSLILMTILLSLTPAYTNTTIPSQLPELQPITRENASKTEQLNILGYGLIDDIAWSPDGKTVAAATTTGVILYDADKFERSPYYRIQVSNPRPISVAFSRDGKYLGIVSRIESDTWAEINAQDKVINIWDLKRQVIVAEWKARIDFPSIIFSPDSNSIVLREREIAQEWDIHEIDNIRFYGEKDWNALQKQWYLPKNVQLDEIDSTKIIAIAPNGQYIAESGDDDKTRIWDVAKKTIKSTIPYLVDWLLFSPRGDLAAFFASSEAYDELTIWDVDHDMELFRHSEVLVGWAFNPIKPQLLISEVNSNMSLWDKETNAVQFVLGYEEQWWRNNVYGVAFNIHGNELAVARMYQVEVWDSLSGVKLQATDANEDGKFLNSIAYSPDGTLIASAGQDGYVRLWDAKTLNPMGAIEHTGNVYDVAFSPDGNLLATYSTTKKDKAAQAPYVVSIWYVKDVKQAGKPLQSEQAAARIFHGEPIWLHEIFNARFSPDSKTLAITSRVVELWDIVTLLHDNPTAQKDVSEHGFIRTIGNEAGPIAWSPDGQQLAIGQKDNQDCSFTTWAVTDGNQINCMERHIGYVTALAFSPKGDLVASAASSHENYPPDQDSDNSIRIWDTKTGKQLGLLDKHLEDIWTVAFNGSGTLIASGSGGCYHCDTEGNSVDGTVRLWGVPKS